MKISTNRRVFLRLAGCSLALAKPFIANALDYPTRPVRLLVGFSPGGTADIASRLIGQALSERLGQQFAVENRPGASSNLATEMVAKASPDGYVLLDVTATNGVNASLYNDLPFDLTRDFAMVAGIVQMPLVLQVAPALGVSTVQDLIAYGKANPGKLSMGSFGTGSTSHVAGELFKMNTGIEAVHVPYRGSAPMITGLLANEIQFAIDNLPGSIGFIKSGQLRALAVLTKERSQSLPGVPALSEFPFGFEASGWNGLAAPKATPPAIIAALNASVNEILADPKVATRITDLGGVSFPTSPSGFDAFVADEVAKWGKVVKAANIKPE